MQQYAYGLDPECCTKDIGDSIIYAKSARDMWMHLEEGYGHAKEEKFYQVLKEVCNIS